jgi:hypothetical protein
MIDRHTGIVYLKEKDGALSIPADALSLASVSGYTFDQANQQIVLHTTMAGTLPHTRFPHTLSRHLTLSCVAPCCVM